METTNKIIYLVTSGEYSSYGVSAVFDSRELAEMFIANDPGYEIEEYELNPHEKLLREGFALWKVVMDRDGNTQDVSHCWVDGREDYIGYDGFMRAYMVARDEKHAVKIANERRAKLIATDQWGVPVR